MRNIIIKVVLVPQPKQIVRLPKSSRILDAQFAVVERSGLEIMDDPKPQPCIWAEALINDPEFEDRTYHFVGTAKAFPDLDKLTYIKTLHYSTMEGRKVNSFVFHLYEDEAARKEVSSNA